MNRPAWDFDDEEMLAELDDMADGFADRVAARLRDLLKALDEAYGRASVARNQNGTEIGWEAAQDCEHLLFDALARGNTRVKS